MISRFPESLEVNALEVNVLCVRHRTVTVHGNPTGWDKQSPMRSQLWSHRVFAADPKRCLEGRGY